MRKALLSSKVRFSSLMGGGVVWNHILVCAGWIPRAVGHIYLLFFFSYSSV